MAGISDETFRRYMKEPPPDFVDFVDRITRAEAQVIARAVATVVKAASPDPKTKEAGDWRAAAWLLERRRPDEFKEKRQIDVSKLDDETLLRLLEEEAEG